jgi:CO/xanthine dehydrogenase FAD-binding subunit
VQRLDDHLTVAVGGLEAVPRYWREQQGILEDLKGAVVLSDVHASADYRRHLASVLVQDGIDEVMAA